MEFLRVNEDTAKNALRANSLPSLIHTHTHTHILTRTISGTGKIEKVKKGGAGKGNWGKPGDQEGCGVYLDKGDPMYPDDE